MRARLCGDAHAQGKSVHLNTIKKEMNDNGYADTGALKRALAKAVNDGLLEAGDKKGHYRNPNKKNKKAAKKGGK